MTASSPSRGPSQFYLVLQVWGEAYTRSFTDIALPALLAEGNIPALAASRPTTLKLYTTDADMERIRHAPSFVKLQEYVRVDYSSLDGLPQGDKYVAMTAIQRSIVRQSLADDAALVWILPDTIWSDGSLRTVARAADAGKRGVMHAGIRVSKSSALPVAHELIGGAAVVSVDPRRLVRVALEHMHPYYRAFYWDAPEFNRNPVNIYWRVGNDGMVMRGFHLHPLMIYPSRRVETFVSTFDDDLPLLACPNADDFYIATDSDEAFEIDLAEDDWARKVLTLSRPPSPAYLATWAFGGGNLHHRAFADATIRIHATELDGRWTEAAAASDLVMARVRRWLQVRYVMTSLLRWLGGVSRQTLLDALPHGVGWHLCPPVRPWVKAWEWAFHALRLRPIARLPERFYRFAFRHALYEVLGKNVTIRALDLDLMLGKPWRMRLRALWWRVVRPRLYVRYKRVRLGVRHWRRRTSKRFVHAYKSGRKHGRRYARLTMRAPREGSIAVNKAFRKARRARRDATDLLTTTLKRLPWRVTQGRRRVREMHRGLRRTAKDYRPRVVVRRSARVARIPIRVLRRVYHALISRIRQIVP